MRLKFFTIISILALTILLVGGTGTAHALPVCDPAYVTIAGNEITVIPTGVDDTANLQCAFDAATATGPGTNVHLVAGEYFTAQIVVSDFQGEFSGAGPTETAIYNLPNLPVAPYCCSDPPSDETPWPDLFIFVGGEFSISRLAIHIVGEFPVEPWSIFGLTFDDMGAAIIIMGLENHTEIDQVLIQGETKASSPFGYNLINGIYYEGAMEWLGYPPISGSYRLTNSTFRTVGYASPLWNLANASVLISHNYYEDTTFATDGADLVDSTIEYSHNRIDGALIGLDFWNSDPLPDTGTTFLVKNNQIRTYLAGVAFEQVLGEGNQCLVLGNNVQQSADIGIFLGPGIHHCTVVGGSNKTNVLDLGTDNILVGVNNMGTGVGLTIGSLLRPR
jgi:hypothetical protein